MNPAQLVELLDACVATIAPFGETLSIGERYWNGTEYAPVTAPQPGDPFAKAWAASLSMASGLLKREDHVTSAQISFLSRELLGGMGSLQDFSLKESHWGLIARDANGRLSQLLSQLHDILRTKGQDA